MFSHLKAGRPDVPGTGTAHGRPAQASRFGVPAAAVRPLGAAAVACAAAFAIAGCQPLTTASPSGTAPSGSTTSSASASASAPAMNLPAQTMALAAQQSQQIRSFTGLLSIQATGALNLNLFGTVAEQTQPTPLVEVQARVSGLPGMLTAILNGTTAYLKSSFLTRGHARPWAQMPYSSMQSSSMMMNSGSSSSGVNLGSLLQQLLTTGPQAQTQMFTAAPSMQAMGTSMISGFPVSQFAGSYNLGTAMGRLSSGLQPTVQSEMNTGISRTQFRVWIGKAHHLVRKLVLVEFGKNTRITITLTITSVNRPVTIMIPPNALIIGAGGTTMPMATPTPTKPMVTMTPAPGMTATPAPGATTPAPTPTGVAPTHW